MCRRKEVEVFPGAFSSSLCHLEGMAFLLWASALSQPAVLGGPRPAESRPTPGPRPLSGPSLCIVIVMLWVVAKEQPSLWQH